jgi:hypothetical protein
MTFGRIMLVITVLTLIVVSIAIGWYAATWPAR